MRSNIEDCAVSLSQALTLICDGFVAFGYPWWLKNLHVLIKSKVYEGSAELFGSLVSVSLKCFTFEVLLISDMFALVTGGVQIAEKNKLKPRQVPSHVGLLLNQLGTLLESLLCELIVRFVTVLTICGADNESELQKSDVIMAMKCVVSFIQS